MVVYQGIYDGQKHLTLNRRGNTQKTLITEGCRALKSDKKSAIHYTLKCSKGY